MSHTNDNASIHPPKRPQCPQCGKPLTLEGGIVSVGTHKKWIDQWRCSHHGAVRIARPEDSPPATA